MSSRVTFFDDPSITRINGWAEGLATLWRWLWLVAWVATIVAVLTALLVWRYHRPVAVVGVGTAILCGVLTSLSAAPGRTFQSAAQGLHAEYRPAAAVGVLVAIALLPVRRQAVRGRCPNCNYSLTGNVSGVCPECGTTAPPRPNYGDAVAMLSSMSSADSRAGEDEAAPDDPTA